MIGYVPLVHPGCDTPKPGADPNSALHCIEIDGRYYPCTIVFDQLEDAQELSRLPDVVVAVVEFFEIPNQPATDSKFFPCWFSGSRFCHWF